MEIRKVVSPGPVGSPLATATRALGGSVVGTDHLSDAGSAEDCAIASEAARNPIEAAMRTHRRRETRIPSFIFPLLRVSSVMPDRHLDTDRASPASRAAAKPR